jgi:hypothetical protein
MSAAKLVDLQDGLQVFASSGIETRFMQEKIFQLGCYQADLPPGSLVIDAGAHIGMFTLFVKLAHPDAEILAFEPAPETIRPRRASRYAKIEVFAGPAGLAGSCRAPTRRQWR